MKLSVSLQTPEALGRIGDHQRFIREAVEKELKAQGFLPDGDAAA